MGAVGGSTVPEAAEVVEEMLLWRVEVLCRRSIDPLLCGRCPNAPRPTCVALLSPPPLSMASPKDV
jgi:hypothetical protein